MANIFDVLEGMENRDKLDMDIILNVPKTELVDFRFTFGNMFTSGYVEGGTLVTDDVEKYTESIKNQICGQGYYISMSEGVFFDNCFYVYLSEEDKKSESPYMEVYVHPNELSGWAPKTDMEKLKDIAEQNEYTSNVKLVYACEVYNISDNEYEAILKESEPEIIEWLKRYKAHYKRKMGGAVTSFNKIFGIQRISTRHLYSKDYVAENYVRKLLLKNNF